MEGTRRPPAKNKTGEICWDTSSFRSSKFYSTRTTLKQVTPVWNTGVTLSDCRAEAARIFEQQVVPAVSATPECAVRFGREATYGSDAAHLSKKANGHPRETDRRTAPDQRPTHKGAFDDERPLTTLCYASFARLRNLRAHGFAYARVVASCRRAPRDVRFRDLGGKCSVESGLSAIEEELFRLAWAAKRSGDPRWSCVAITQSDEYRPGALCDRDLRRTVKNSGHLVYFGVADKDSFAHFSCDGRPVRPFPKDPRAPRHRCPCHWHVNPGAECPAPTVKCFQGRYDFIHPAFGCASEGCACGGEDGLVWHDPLAPAYRRRLFKGMRAPGGKTQGKRKRAADEDAEGEDLPPVKVSRVAALRDARGGGDDEGIDIGE